jgi:hypothetical protein
MKFMKRFLLPEIGIFLAVWLVLMIGGRSRFLRDPGTFWHTVVGEQMLASGQLIYHDTFSFTFAGHAWSPHQWLGECIMAGLHRVGGLDSVLLVTVTSLSCLYTWLAWRLMRGGLHWSLAGFCVALTVAASSSHFHIRPHIATILFTGVTFGFLIDFEGRRIASKRMWLLVPVYLLWSNIHGGMLGGLATIGLAINSWFLAKAIGLPSPLGRYRQAIPLAGVLLACGLTALVNPYGLRLPMIWMEIMDSPILPQIIKEHAPLDPSKPDGLVVLVFASIYVATLIGTVRTWPRMTWLLPMVWFYLACTRVRHAPLFSMTAALAIADMLPHTVWARILANRESDLFRYPNPLLTDRTRQVSAFGLLPLAIIALGLVLQARQVPLPLLGHSWARLDPEYWPTEVRPILERLERSRPAGTPIFNEYLDGGYLIYFAPGFKVFVDDRCELYGDQWLEDYVHAESQDTARQMVEWQRRYPAFDLALTRSGSAFDSYFGNAKDWSPLCRTATATIYERSTSLHRAAAN